jgi:hypothetical protein
MEHGEMENGRQLHPWWAVNAQKTMRTFLFIVMMFCQITHSLGQNASDISADGLAGIEWRIDGQLGLDTARVGYTLTPFKEGMFPWGTSFSFSQSGNTFSSGNSAPCGNDCFITVNGTYAIEQGNVLRIAVREVTYSDYCPNAKRKPDAKASMHFQMTFQSDTLLLTKVNSGVGGN